MNVLIIRTIQLELMVRLIRALQKQDPEVKIAVLTNPQQVDRVTRLREVDQVFVTRAFRNFSLLNIGLKNIFSIRKQGFDRVIIPHKQPGLTGFGNVLILLPLLGIAEWCHCGTDWKLLPVRKSSPAVLFLRGLGAVLLFVPLALIPLLGFLYVWLRQDKSPRARQDKTWYAGFGDL